jgi:ribosomal protein L11 methylase PrmA
MSDFDPQAAEVAAHQAHLNALDRLDEAEESGDRAAIRSAQSEVERTKREWHRLVRMAESAQRKRSS